jgi:hypothetical protein
MAKTTGEGSESCSISLNIGKWWIGVGEKEGFISSKILKYIEFQKLGMSKDDLYSRVMGPYVKYWENVLELLSRPIPHRIMFSWKVFGLLPIGELIMNAHSFLPL